MKLFVMAFLFSINSIGGLEFESLLGVGPHIQCTIIKTYGHVEVLGFKNFPSLYQSIFHDPLDSVLIMGNIKFDGLSPKSVLKTENYEKIVIPHKEGQLELELHGRPMSRRGILKESDKIIAEITCH